ncbi:tail repeat like protein [Microcystis phage MJing1]|nr:tail repeat like protein [Microcystis phage MJing1]
MSVTTTHQFVSAKPDGDDPTIVQPSDWNDPHVVKLSAIGLVGRGHATEETAVVISIGAGLALEEAGGAFTLVVAGVEISDVTGLQTALDGKAASSHGHAISDVTGLQTALDGKAAADHDHAIGDVTGLQDALDGKAPLRGEVVTVSDATFTPSLSHENDWIRLTNAGGCAVTLPNDAAVAFPIGAEIVFQQANATSMSFAPTGGAPAIEFPSTHLASTNVRHAIVAAKKVAADTWAIVGNLRLA